MIKEKLESQNLNMAPLSNADIGAQGSWKKLHTLVKTTGICYLTAKIHMNSSNPYYLNLITSGIFLACEMGTSYQHYCRFES